MNKIMFDVMLLLNEGITWDVKKYAKKLYKPYSVISQEYKNLEYEGFVENGKLTEKGVHELQNHSVKNAIILAAGVSSRFVPLCFEKPKGLLKIKGEVLIERQIKQLREKGIDEIVVVVGHMKEKFCYLKEKYNVILVETDTYKTRNNHASLYAAREYLSDTIVTSSDLYFTENIFQQYSYDAYYSTVYHEGDTEERGIVTDATDMIVDTSYGVSNVWVTLGYAYFNKRFSDNFLKILDVEYEYSETKTKFWADIQDEHLHELYMYAKRIDNGVIYEFDSLEELRDFDYSYVENSDSELMRKIADMLNAPEGKLKNFKPILKEDLGRGFTFELYENKYICRISDNKNIEDIRRYDDSVQELANLAESFVSYYNLTLPLCAAENVISPFVKLPLSMGFQERYIVGNTYSYTEEDNFIGSTYLLPFYQMIGEKCKQIFSAKYTDARTLTGMNCLMMVLTALSESGDNILILGSEAGGHSSVKPIAKRLGLNVDEVPFDYEEMDVDYNKLNQMIEENNIQYVLLAPSDLIKAPNVEKINTLKTTLLYDASQVLGLMGAGLIDNPLKKVDNMVMFGGTHKTFPGPASGLILTNNDNLHNKLERTINPIYIRHTQMHQKVSLLFALIEFEVFGRQYQERIIALSNALAKELSDLGFDVGRNEGRWTDTHQVFIYTDKDTMNRIYNNGLRLGITLNKKQKSLFRGYGIRLGTQEIARYGWPIEEMKKVAEVLKELSANELSDDKVRKLLMALPNKEIQYTFDHSVNARFERFIKDHID